METSPSEVYTFQFPKFIIDFGQRIVGVTILKIGENPLIGRLFGNDNRPADNRPKRYRYISKLVHT